jgi:hypothetical protein
VVGAHRDRIVPMQLKVPLSPNATLDRALARAVVAQGLWSAGETGLFVDVPPRLAELHLRPVAGAGGRDGPDHRPWFLRGPAPSNWQRVSLSATWSTRSRTLALRPSLPEA